MEWEHGAPRKWCLYTTDKREAERLLHEERVKTEKRHHGLLPSQDATDAAKTPLIELLGRFVARRRESGCSAMTVKKYGSLHVLFEACRWKLAAHVTARSFYDWRTHSDRSGKTKNDALKNTCNFFGWLRQEGLVQSNPLEFVEPVKLTPTHFRRALTPEQAQRLLSVAADGRDAVYLVAMQVGLRRKELQGLTVADFVFDTPAPFVRVPASLSKNRTEATLPLRPEAVDAIRSVLPSDAKAGTKVFAGIVPRLPRFKKDLALAGIPFEDERGRRVDLHALRVTLGSNLFASGASLVVVKELMRHSDIKTTLRHYSDSSQLPLAAAVANLPSLSLRPSGTLLGTHGTQMGTQAGVA